MVPDNECCCGCVSHLRWHRGTAAEHSAERSSSEWWRIKELYLSTTRTVLTRPRRLMQIYHNGFPREKGLWPTVVWQGATSEAAPLPTVIIQEVNSPPVGRPTDPMLWALLEEVSSAQKHSVLVFVFQWECRPHGGRSQRALESTDIWECSYCLETLPKKGCFLFN